MTLDDFGWLALPGSRRRTHHLDPLLLSYPVSLGESDSVPDPSSPMPAPGR